MISHGLIIDQILFAQCMYLMMGEKDTKFSKHLTDYRLFLEVHDCNFSKSWNGIFRKVYIKHIQAKYNFSKKKASIIFDKMHQDVEIIRKIRI